MAFTVNFYTFTKRQDSTARPASGSATVYNCVLKEPCGVLSPTIGINMGLTVAPAFNYADIPDFGRYYFISEWTFSGGIWYASMEVDALATYKTQIGASTQYILRSAHTYDGNIIDTTYPTTGAITVASDMLTPLPWATTLSNGTYVVGIINPDLSGTGAVSYYVFTQSQFNDLCDQLLSSPSWVNWDPTEISEELGQSLFNPFQYIVSCMWVPFTAPTVGSMLSSVTFGWWTMTVDCYRLSQLPLNFITPEFTIPKHPQAATRGAFLNLSPYSRYTLFFKPFGTLPIDTTFINNAASIKTIIYTDCISGVGTLALTTTGLMSGVFFENSAKIGVPIQLAQITRDYVGGAISAIGGLSGAITSAMAGNIAGAFMGAASGITSTVQSMLPQLSTSGGNGSISDFAFNPVLVGQFFPVVDETLTHRGRPLCTEKQISTVPGYLMVADADVALPATEQEISTVKAFLEGGFFYE